MVQKKVTHSDFANVCVFSLYNYTGIQLTEMFVLNVVRKVEARKIQYHGIMQAPVKMEILLHQRVLELSQGG